MLRIDAKDVGLNIQRHQGHGQHSAFHMQQLADHVETPYRAQFLPEPLDQQIADRVTVQRSGAMEPGLEDVRPLATDRVVAAQCRKGHPKVAGRQPAQLSPQSPGRSAVVGHRHDGGQAISDLTQCLQGCGQPVPTAQRRHPWQPLAAHSRPRSRCKTLACTPFALSRSANSSLIAVERCLPPVQPMATVACNLPSR